MSQMKSQIDLLLGNVSSKYVPKGYICEQVLPEIQSAQYTGKLGIYGSAHLRIENSLKGGRGKYRRVETTQSSTTSFDIEGHGLEGFISKEDYRNKLEPFDAEVDEVEGITEILFLEKEKMLADTLTSTAILTQNVTLSGTSQFSDLNNSDPLGVAATARAAILDGCGFLPNMAIMDVKVWNILRFHPALLDSLGFKQARPGGITQDEMAIALGVDKVLYANARYNSAKEGQTAVLAPVWGKDIVFCVSPESAQKKQTALGYMVRLQGSAPRKVSKWANNNPSDSTSVLVEDEYDMLISNATAGYVIKAAIA